MDNSGLPSGRTVITAVLSIAAAILAGAVLIGIVIGKVFF